MSPPILEVLPLCRCPATLNLAWPYTRRIMHSTLNLLGFLPRSSIGILRRFRQQKHTKYLLVLFMAACGYPERPTVISISNLGTFRPASPRDIKSVEQALAAIITVCRDDLKFPPVQTFEANLYKNSQSFASYGVDWRMFPTDVARMTAFARGSKIHVDLQKVNDDTGWALSHGYLLTKLVTQFTTKLAVSFR